MLPPQFATVQDKHKSRYLDNSLSDKLEYFLNYDGDNIFKASATNTGLSQVFLHDFLECVLLYRLG